MSKAPYINFYTSDFLAGTSGMTASTKGVYITLLCLMYETESVLTHRWDSLARRCGCTVPAFKKAIQDLSDDGKVIVSDEGLWSETCDKHLAQRVERRSGAKAAAKIRWEKDKQKQGEADADASLPQCQPEPEPEETLGTDVPSDGQAVDAVEIIWSKCLDWLISQQIPERQARSMIGKWLKDNPPEVVRSAFVDAWRAKTGDPIPYITEVLRPVEKPDVNAMIQSALKRMNQNA